MRTVVPIMRFTNFSLVRCAVIILLTFVITLIICKNYINASQAYLKMNYHNVANWKRTGTNSVQRPTVSPTIQNSSTSTTTTSSTAIITAATTTVAATATTVSNPLMSSSALEKSVQVTLETSITPTQNGMQNTSSTTVTDEVVPKSAIVIQNLTINDNTSAAKYFTLSFDGSCAGRLSNKLFEFVSAYGIARTLNRIPYIDVSFTSQICVRLAFNELSSYFPQLGNAFQLVMINESNVLKTTLGGVPCCVYGDVNKLKEYHSIQYLQLNEIYLQSYKYFHQYRQDVLKLLTFTDEDIKATDTIALGTYKNDRNHKICLHTRRSDFVRSDSIHQESTEKFTKDSALYVHQKLRHQGKSSTIVLLGDDRSWLNQLIKDGPWALVPPKTDRPTTDYAFFARHCQTIILTAPASTFAIWSAYLSSAEKIYFNIDFAKGDGFKPQIAINDFFPMEWIPLSQNTETGVISELPRSIVY